MMLLHLISMDVDDGNGGAGQGGEKNTDESQIIQVAFLTLNFKLVILI
jgi:hypothetical protein